MWTRRSFLQTSLYATAAVPLVRAGDATKPLVGSQLYGWGQYYGREGKKLEDNLDEVFSALRDAGYDYAEHGLSADPEANVRLGDRLKSKGLRPVSLYTGGAFHEEKAADVQIERLVVGARGAKEAGFSVINCNPDPIGRAKTDAELNTQAQSLNAFGQRLREMGMQLGIHNHTPEMQNDAKEFHHNLRETKPEDVGFCYDVHWVFRGGLSPEEVLPLYGARVVSWHLRQSRDRIWWEDLDTGDVDYAFVAKYAQAHHLAPLYTVELAIEDGTKITRSVVENHARSREFVRQVFNV